MEVNAMAMARTESVIYNIAIKLAHHSNIQSTSFGSLEI